MSEIFAIAPSITTPIAFAALSLLVVFLLTRQLLQLPVFSNVGQRHSAGIIIRIVNRLFLLALVVTVLVFLLSLLPKILDWVGPRDSKPNAEQAIGAAKEVLSSFYENDTEAFYQALPLSVQAQFGYRGTENVMRRERFQLERAPIARAAPDVEILSGNAVVTFEAEFDQTSVWRETLTFVIASGEWRLWSLNVYPAIPPASPTQFIPQTSATEFLSAGDKSVLKGRWISPPGWLVSILSVDRKTGDYTCDVTAATPDRGVPIRLSNVLGGCRLKAGVPIVIVAQFAGALQEVHEFTNVRFYPEA